MEHGRRMKKSKYVGRHLLQSGNFYYKIYEDNDGMFFSDPHTFNCESVLELKVAINKEPRISMNSSGMLTIAAICKNFFFAFVFEII